MFSLNFSNTTSSFLLICWKVCKKLKPAGFALYWACDLQQSKGHWKWHAKLEVNSAYTLGRYEHVWSRSLDMMSHAKVFAKQNGLLVKQTWLITSICYSYESKTYTSHSAPLAKHDLNTKPTDLTGQHRLSHQTSPQSSFGFGIPYAPFFTLALRNQH